MSKIWFTADTHFSHGRIIQHCSRPFSSIEEMDNTMIDNINSRVKSDDTLYHLGDFAFHGKNALQYRQRIKCHNVILIKGNHDPCNSFGSPEVWFKNLFTRVHDILTITVQFSKEKKTVVLCHYAMKIWPKKHYGAIHLFGHSHGRLRDHDLGSMDVGVDPNNFMPICVEDIERILERKYQESLMPKQEEVQTLDQLKLSVQTYLQVYTLQSGYAHPAETEINNYIRQHYFAYKEDLLNFYNEMCDLGRYNIASDLLHLIRRSEIMGINDFKLEIGEIALKHSDPCIRDAAIGLLSGLGDPKARALLMRQSVFETEPFLKNYLLDILEHE